MSMLKLNNGFRWKALIFTVLLVPVFTVAGAVTCKRPLTFQDIMKFKKIKENFISPDGRWVLYSVEPDRGNGELIVYGTEGQGTYSIPRGCCAKISRDGRWIAALVRPDSLKWEQAGTEERKKLKSGLALFDTGSGDTIHYDNVKEFSFSEDSHWLVFSHFPLHDSEGKKSTDSKESKKKQASKTDKNSNTETTDAWSRQTTPLVLRSLDHSEDIRLENVLSYAIDPSGNQIAYSLYQSQGAKNGVYIRNLAEEPGVERPVQQISGLVFNQLLWSKKRSRLVFLVHKGENNKGNQSEKYRGDWLGLWIWYGRKGKLKPAVLGKDIPRGWMIPATNTMVWTEDGARLFFGFKPVSEYNFYRGIKRKQSKPEGTSPNLYARKHILENRSVDVWHWQDPRIIPQQKIEWDKKKKQTYLAVFHLDRNRFQQLTDRQVPYAVPVENKRFVLASSDSEYLKEITWDGIYYDFFLVDLLNGRKRKVVTRQQYSIALSPLGRFLVFYRDRHWFLMDTDSRSIRNLTAKLTEPFFDEDHDYPQAVPDYGLAGWLEGDQGVLLYDKYDIWQFNTRKGGWLNLTGGIGRKKNIRFRIIVTDPEKKFFKDNEVIMLTAHSFSLKHTHFYRARIGRPGVEALTSGDKIFRFLGKAKEDKRLIFSRESFSEFPDLWLGTNNFSDPVKISNVNPQIRDFNWGKTRLMQWQSLDGIPLQGVVITPENFDPQRRYPVLVYFYRFFSQRLHEFNEMVINHRPNFPYYASHGYVIFLPDIRFEIGRPGWSAVKCLVPGVQKLVEQGIADPKSVALHGHSWSGYLTAFVITQTDIFAAAIAGAPVSNMTSAYCGIRWESGLARQFQYEKEQSRLGESLYDAPEIYIQNSPVFYARFIKTPLLIQHGDRDGKVPWPQSIELYLAMRRLGKDCVFLQYNGEDHHLKRYANKLDYSIKMKEYLDHYLRGKAAPSWLKRGRPYRRQEQ